MADKKVEKAEAKETKKAEVVTLKCVNSYEDVSVGSIFTVPVVIYEQAIAEGVNTKEDEKTGIKTVRPSHKYLNHCKILDAPESIKKACADVMAKCK